MNDTQTVCAVCAWRKDCLKKFNFDSLGVVKCADFCRDLTLPLENDDGEQRPAR
jgi:hypothetical protein